MGQNTRQHRLGVPPRPSPRCAFFLAHTATPFSSPPSGAPISGPTCLPPRLPHIRPLPLLSSLHPPHLPKAFHRRDAAATTAMEDAASEISDWEVLSATSACGGDAESDVILVTGGGGDVLPDHFALLPDPAAAVTDAEFPREGPWAEPGDAYREEWQIEGLELLDRLDSISRGSLDLAAGVHSRQLEAGGVDKTPEEEGSVFQASAQRGATWVAEGGQTNAAEAEVHQEKNALRTCGELDSVVGETLCSDASIVTDMLESEALENLDAQLEKEGVDAGIQSSSLEDVTSEGRQGEQEENEQGSDANAAPCCDELDEEVKDGAQPLVQNPGTGEGEKQVVVWWRLPFRLLHYCAWKVKPVWSFSIAAALLGLVVLGRRMYRMKRKAEGSAAD